MQLLQACFKQSSHRLFDWLHSPHQLVFCSLLCPYVPHNIFFPKVLHRACEYHTRHRSLLGLSNYDYIIFFAILYCNHIHKGTPQTILYSSSNVLYCNWYVLIINHNINILKMDLNIIKVICPLPKLFFNLSLTSYSLSWILS